MFDKFTDRARKVMSLARQEAQRFNHDYIGTEHFLLGFVALREGTGVSVLARLGVTTEKVREEVEKRLQHGPPMVTLEQLPFMLGAKNVLEYAATESSTLGHNYIGTEHLLLGLIRPNGGIAAQVLSELGFVLEEVREEVVEFLDQEPKRHGGAASGETPQKLESPLELTRHGVKRRLAALRVVVAEKKKNDDMGLLGDIPKTKGEIAAFEEVLLALPKDAEVPGLAVALQHCHVIVHGGKLAEALQAKWQGGEVSDDEFIVGVSRLRAEQRGEESPD